MCLVCPMLFPRGYWLCRAATGCSRFTPAALRRWRRSPARLLSCRISNLPSLGNQRNFELMTPLLALKPAPLEERSNSGLAIRIHQGSACKDQFSRWEDYLLKDRPIALSCLPGWLNVLRSGLRHDVYCLEAVEGGAVRGLMPLACVKSFLFGRFLVSLPYLNSGGVRADDEATAAQLIER